jgi:MFS family permease
MNAVPTLPKWRPSKVFLVAGTLVMAGFLLCEVSWWWFGLVAVGAFGPGVLRELGLLRDRDELQLQAARRAGYHAFLVAGIIAVILISVIRATEPELRDPEELATFFLALLWFTWFFSSLVSYWGARKTAARVLLAFGCAWGLFNIAGNLTDPLGMLMQLLLTTSPFFILAWASTRWPRTAGLLLVAAAVFFVVFFGWWKSGSQGIVTQAVTMVLFLGPILVSGVALLAERPQSEE